MKRLSAHRRQYLLRKAKRVARLRKKWAKRPLVRKQIPGFKSIKAPRFFDIGSRAARHTLLAFIENVRNILVMKREGVLIDFSLTERMIAGGTLLFLAELSRCKELLGGRWRVRCIPPRNVRVTQVLKQIGALDLLRYRKRVEPSFSDVIHWRSASGHEVDGEKYDNILGSYDGRVAESLLGSLFRGITEAMTNCHHHAYIKIRPDGLDYADQKRNWWMFSQEKDGYLSVVFCDLGVGIPATLSTSKPSLYKKLMSLGKAGSDCDVIEQAVADSVSRTGKHYRGKGLKQLLEAVQEAKSGALTIFSNRGCYTFTNGKVHLANYVDSIMGTLIAWKVPIVQQELF